MVAEEEGERCFIVALWRSYVPFTLCASALVDHVLLFAAGSGKTILWYAVSHALRALNFILWNSSTIIEEVNRTRKRSDIITRYYFDSKKPDKRSLRGLLASLVTQLCESSKRHPKSLAALHTKCRNGSDPPSEAELTQLLYHLLAELRTQFSIYIVIDGIDHCMEAESTDSPRKKVLKFLEGLVRSRHSKLNICITSSLKDDMERSLKLLAAGVSSRLVILHDQDGHKEDIKTYIAAFVRGHMQTLPDEDKDDVIKTLSERAGGM